MKIPIITPGDHTSSIIQRVIDGALNIASPEEFQDILQIYPDEPLLNRRYADLLYRLKRTREAAQAYERTVGLYVGAGLHLQAIVAKVMQWRIQKPDHQQGRAFHALLHTTADRHMPLQRFWTDMRYPELVAVMRRIVRKVYAPGSILMQINQSADGLYFVVEGVLAEMPSPDCEYSSRTAGIDAEPVLLGPNDVFGEVFPLAEDTFSESQIRALSNVELVGITKSALVEICRKYPRVRRLLNQISRTEYRDNCDRAWQTVRRAMRFGLSCNAEIACYPTEAAPEPWHHTGTAVDVSMGGICVDLGAAPLPAAPKSILKGRLVKLNLDLHDDMSLVQIPGKIVWQRRQETTDGHGTLIGIRFDTLSARDRNVLADYFAQGPDRIHRT